MGVMLVRVQRAPVGEPSEGNLSAMLAQNATEKYIAALTVVEESESGRRTIASHEVLPGETLATIAGRWGVSVRALALSNGLAPEAALTAGQKLLVPPPGGFVYRVEARDTLASIAQRFAVPPTAIAEATGLSLPDFLSSGQLLVIPEAHASVAAVDLPEQTQNLTALSLRAEPTATPFAWPAQGYVGSPFGMRHGRPHRGIDIPGPIGSPIVSVRPGTVIFAGWMHGGFGNAVDVLHADGMVSRYAHLSRVLVHLGEQVERGQTLGARGCTGRCTGPHLHFEIHVGGEAVNPLRYLK